MSLGIVGESDLAGDLQSEYVFFDGERVARREFPGNAISYYFSDYLKRASVITDSAGSIKSESDYYPWGSELQFTSNDSNHYKFTGKERDAETGLDYFGARYYSNALGRFTSADWSPIPHPVPYADFRDPQTLNLFTFVRNLPTVKLDVDGHQQQRSAEELEKEEEEFEKETKEFQEFLRRTAQVAEATAEARRAAENDKADDARVKDGYDDVTGVCHNSPPPSKSGPSVSAPNSPPKMPEFICQPGRRCYPGS